MPTWGTPLTTRGPSGSLDMTDTADHIAKKGDYV